MSDFNLDALLEGTLDDLADLPEFKPFPAGLHKAAVTLEQKVVNNHPSIEVKLKLIEHVELVNSSETPLEAGAEANVLYQLDNEFGQGNLKKFLVAAAQKFGPKKNSELIADMQNCEVAVVTGQRQNKEKTQTYMTVLEVVIS